MFSNKLYTISLFLEFLSILKSNRNKVLHRSLFIGSSFGLLLCLPLFENNTMLYSYSFKGI